MSIVICDDCSRSIDLDVEDDYAWNGKGGYLCEECSEKPADKGCQFCGLGYAKKKLIWRLVKDMSRTTLQELITKNDRCGL